MARRSLWRRALSATFVAASLGLFMSAHSAGAAADGPYGVGSRIEPRGDEDADGILNALDNCLLVANRDQRDTDHDGIGNACDPDLNNDGVVDESDLRMLSLGLGRPGRDADLNSDGVVDRSDREILVSFFGRAPGPRLDSDGDGVPDVADPCLRTPSGSATLIPGCTALEIVQSPGGLLGPPIVKLARISGRLAESSWTLDVARSLDDASMALKRAGRSARAGDPCGSASAFDQSRSSFAFARSRLRALLADARRGTVSDGARRAADLVGDTTDANALVAGLEYWIEQVQDAAALGDGAARALAQVCSVARPVSAAGVVDHVLDNQRRLVLTDGRSFGFADPMPIESDAFDGRAVRILGLDFGDGSGLATQVRTEGEAPAVPKAQATTPCLDLRFAPVQPWAPFNSSPYLLHYPIAYERDGAFQIEMGSGFAAHSSCASASGVLFTKYSLRLEATYRDVTIGQTVSGLLAPDLQANDEPVLVPDSLDTTAAATLTVTNRSRSCQLGPSLQVVCADPTVLLVRTYPLHVHDRGALATAMYEETKFDVNDQLAEDWRPAHVTLFTGQSVDPATSTTFLAEGYLNFYGLSSFPDVFALTNGDKFSIHSQDFYPVFGDPSGPLAGLAVAATGVTHASGLQWPRITGKNQGQDYQYSVSLPYVVRDAVNFCYPTNAYYRLPFAHGDLGWTQGQGNLPSNPNATHYGGYAYDMLAALDSNILAARAGRVVKLTESNSQQCNPGDGCSPNNVFIEHQDGSIGEYVHMPLNGVIPEKDDVVHRGELIAHVGVVGPTSGPHLHFATRTAPKPGGTTFLALFEALVPTDDKTELPLLCYEPQPGDALRSNNKTWP